MVKQEMNPYRHMVIMRCLPKILQQDLGPDIMSIFQCSDEEEIVDSCLCFESKIPDAKFKDYLDKRIQVKYVIDEGLSVRDTVKYIETKTNELDYENSKTPQFKVEHSYVTFFELALA